jgi:hypothetical protein
VEAVDLTGRWRWERVLLVLAALFGVVAMHSTVGPMHEPAMPPSATAASMSSAEYTVAAIATSSDMPVHEPTSMPHALMHLCLAILAAGIALGLLAVAIMILLGHELAPPRTHTRVATRPSRPPRRNALRLAQLCVLRN